MGEPIVIAAYDPQWPQVFAALRHPIPKGRDPLSEVAARSVLPAV